MCQTSAQVGTQIRSQKILTGQQGLALEKKDCKDIFSNSETIKSYFVSTLCMIIENIYT